MLSHLNFLKTHSSLNTAIAAQDFITLEQCQSKSIPLQNQHSNSIQGKSQQLITLTVLLKKYGVASDFIITSSEYEKSSTISIQDKLSAKELTQPLSDWLTTADGELFEIATTSMAGSTKNTHLLFKVFFGQQRANEIQQDIPLIIISNAENKITLYYNASIYQSTYIDWFMDCYQHLNRALEDNATTAIQVLDVQSEEQEEILLSKFASVGAGYFDTLLHEEIDLHATKLSDVTAVVYHDSHITYKQLRDYSDKLAKNILTYNTASSTTQNKVVMFLSRSQFVPITLLGILKSGAVYVPIDIDTPSERIKYMLQEVQPSCIITEPKVLPLLDNAIASDINVINIEQAINNEAPEITLPKVDLDDTAYIIFTSGSTGNPKGVPIPHKSLTNHVLSFADFQGVLTKPGWRGTFLAALGFDVSLMQLFFQMYSGATMHVIDDAIKKNPQALAEYILAEKIEYTSVPPVLLEGLGLALESIGQQPVLRLLGSGGESVSRPACERVQALCPGLTALVGYGPTESTIAASVHRVSDQDPALSYTPIGKPLKGYRIYILDESNKLQPFGIAGELVVGGDVLSSGYLNNAALTTEKFIPDPFNAGTSSYMYKTGDIAKYLPNGDILFLGRSDDQVKIQGVRVELGEIESVIKDISGAINSVATTQKEGLEKEIIVYLEKPQKSKAHIREAIKAILPKPMQPAALVFIDSLPLNTNNKIDKKSLPAPQHADYTTTEYTSPDSPEEQKITDIACTMFSKDIIGVEDDLTTQGINSILFVGFIGMVNNEFEVDLAAADIAKCKTIRDIAQCVKTSLALEA